MTYYITEHATYEVEADTPKAALQKFLETPSKFPVDVNYRDVCDKNGNDLTAETGDE